MAQREITGETMGATGIPDMLISVQNLPGFWGKQR
ncbi:hypothetical protein BHECKSOX_1331 [Bathymodiolus heckerae thiotrophic gill symbiont]|nr:hypothetical protein BHECKSOX_1331 [Bathymodiolus heckerae thiotrophic gill symbiont]